MTDTHVVAEAMRNQILVGDSAARLGELPAESIHSAVTSPPFWGLRDYRVQGQLGRERTPEQYIDRLVEILRHLRRTLRPDGTLWLNLGDCYARAGSGLKPTDLVGIPWRVALALQADGWYLRCDIVWKKPNTMPESVTSRPTKAHEYLFLLSKSARYYYDGAAIREPLQDGDHHRNVLGQASHVPGDSPHAGLRRYGAGNVKRALADGTKGGRSDHLGSGVPWVDDGSGRNARSVWTINTRPFKGAHFAVFPPALPMRCIKAGTSELGCCEACGMPYRRIKGKVAADGKPPVVIEKRRKAQPSRTYSRHHSSIPGGQSLAAGTKITLGWEVECGCGAGVGRSVVIDPFAGSGTTLLVAKQLGRDFIGIDLNPSYCDMARERLDKVVSP